MSHDEIIEQAARVLCTLDHGDPDGLIREYDEFGRFTTSEFAWTEYVAQAQALAEAGLLARPLPSRDEIEDTILNALREQFNTYGDVADTILALLKEQDT